MTTFRLAAARRRWAHRARVLEAVALLCAAGAAQRWVPMRRWSGVLGRPGPVPDEWRGRRIEQVSSRALAGPERQATIAVRRAGQLLPWKPTCLAEAAAGQVLLRQLGQPGVVVLGLRPPDSGDRGGTWDAHAWLLGRDGALTGGPAARGFTPTTVYEVQGSPPDPLPRLSPNRHAL